MSNCGHHGLDTGRGCANQTFIRERQQVFHRSAAARNDNHVHPGHLLEFDEGASDLLYRILPLDRHFPNLKASHRPPNPRIFQDVVFGLGIPTTNQPDAVRYER